MVCARICIILGIESRTKRWHGLDTQFDSIDTTHLIWLNFRNVYTGRAQNTNWLIFRILFLLLVMRQHHRCSHITHGDSIAFDCHRFRLIKKAIRHDTVTAHLVHSISMASTACKFKNLKTNREIEGEKIEVVAFFYPSQSTTDCGDSHGIPFGSGEISSTALTTAGQ